jgi:hypothetical protein
MHLGRGVGGTCTTMRLHISFYSAMSRGESPLMESEQHLAVCFTCEQGMGREHCGNVSS